MSVSPAPAQSESASASAAGWWQRVRYLLGIGSPGDWIFKQICQASAFLVIVVVGLIVVLLIQQARPAITKVGLSILTSTEWKPNPDDPNRASDFGHLGGLTFIYGSVATSLLAMLLAVPLGVGTAAFLAEIATGWMKRLGSFLVELLAAIPSVVYGFWGINVLAPRVVQPLLDHLGGGNVGGKCILSASIILAIMIVPYIAAVSYDVCQAVPRAQREGALALGATRWQTIWRVVLPYARPGILGGCFLALGRAIGETMAVTMLIGNVNWIEPLPFGQGSTIPSVIAQELPTPTTDLHRSALIELGLLLFGVTIIMNVLARILIWRVGQPRRGRSLLLRLFLRRHRPTSDAVPPTSQAEDGRASQVGAATTAPSSPGAARQPSNTRWVVGTSRIMTGVLGLCLILTCGPLFLILGYITVRGIGALDLAFFISMPRPQGDPEGTGGLANGLLASGIIVGLASLFAIPLGLLAAIFLAEYRTSRLAPVVRFFGELLNGVPSIVVGTFVYALVRYFIEEEYLRPRRQFSGLAGAFALSIMMLPIIMRASEEALKLVPDALRNASHALGAFHWQTVLYVSVPAALPAIITAAFLAIARIGGETAPLLITTFGSDRLVLSPSEPMKALPMYIYQYSLSGYPPFEEKAWAAALVLLAFVMILNVGIRVLTGKRVVLASRAG
jgi:phosphate transport system permease protein